MGVFTPLRTARLPAAMLGALLPEQTTQLREIFDSFDGDHDGLLDAMEVGTVAQLCGFQMSQTEVIHMVTEMAPAVRKLGFEDFVSVLTRPLPGVSPDDEMRRMFGQFAAAGDVITVDSLHAAFITLGHPISILMAADMLREADFDEDGVVSRDDFMQTVP